MSTANSSENTAASDRQTGPWNWHPSVPLQMPPLFAWPPKPIESLKFIFGKGFMLSQMLIYVLLAIITWKYLLPPMEQWATFSVGWVAHVFLLNTFLSLFVAGGLHLYFHTFKKQGSVHKYERRDLARKNKAFLFNNQNKDNMFLSLTSGGVFWTAWQVLYMWAYANNYLPWTSFSSNPVWFVTLFLILAMWGSMHFYFVHRLIHWPPLYKVAHALHHKNVVIGPWSGLAMHPIEHFIYFSVAIGHLIIASHPIHLKISFH
jgi:lathosterol oxidase